MGVGILNSTRIFLNFGKSFQSKFFNTFVTIVKRYIFFRILDEETHRCQ